MVGGGVFGLGWELGLGRGWDCVQGRLTASPSHCNSAVLAKSKLFSVPLLLNSKLIQAAKLRWGFQACQAWSMAEVQKEDK